MKIREFDTRVLQSSLSSIGFPNMTQFSKP